jgi:hypothetical protein
MDGLIDAARRNIWAVVNDLALTKPAPTIRIAFLTYGNDGHEADSGWVKVHTPLTGDLDLISQEFFAQTTNGGTELVARVVDRAVNSLDWSTSPDALKIIIVAGNEAATQDTEISYQDASRRAIAKGIMVNAIYCGSASDPEASDWRNVSLLADGAFASIDQNETIVEIPTPFDSDLVTLNLSINTTYIAYGAKGDDALVRQTVEDNNNFFAGASAGAARVACKATSAYSNSGWDLVDACKEDTATLDDISDEDLPDEMKDMTIEERKAYVAGKQAERLIIAQKITALNAQREAFIIKEKTRLAVDESRSLGSVLRKAIRQQAQAKGIQVPAPPQPETPVADAQPVAPAESNAGS